MKRIKRARIFRGNTILARLYSFWLTYISPGNFNYLWNFGSLAFVCLIFQIITGVFLAMHYKSDIALAFASVQYISTNVTFGWFMRYLHSNTASIFFIVVYLHMLRTFVFGSFMYPRQMLWGSGVILFVLMIITAFFGYVLPWGQMSFWAATVITSLFSAIPIVGMDIVLWLWGGFSVNDATLNRFFSLHFFLPFVIFMLSIIHMMLLHEFGSSNPQGLIFRPDGLFMSPFYFVKDLNGMTWVFIFLAYLVCFKPNYMGHPDNYIIANSMVTPAHIVPEWYFLPLYAILRSVPSKLLGIIVLALAILILLFLPVIVGKLHLNRSIYYKPLLKILIILVIINCLVLGWVGGKPVIAPYFVIGQISTFFYFFLFIAFGFVGYCEQISMKDYSITGFYHLSESKYIKYDDDDDDE